MIAERVSFLLHDDASERERTRREAEDLYGTRSDVVHGTKDFRGAMSFLAVWPALRLARAGLLRILECKDLFKLFSEGSVEDIDRYFQGIER